MSHLLTDVTPILTRAFPTGKPEMSASDFDRAHKFVVGRRSGSVPVPGPLSMDYAWWAHTMIVEWRMTVEDWEAGGRQGPEPTFLLCPECNVMLLLDTMQNDVLMCPGGCHRAITVATFVSLFKPPPKPSFRNVPPTRQNHNNSITGSSLNSVVSPPSGPIGLDRTVPKGARPEDYGITEGVQKSRKPIVGWRMWKLLVDGDGKVNIDSMHQGHGCWRPMEPARGLCAGYDDPSELNHRCPSWEHRCGIHAVKEIEQLQKWGNPDSKVLGQVEMWGRVLEYEQGYRAEWAYPIKLFLQTKNKAYEERLWEAYLTEVVIDDDIFKQAYDR